MLDLQFQYDGLNCQLFQSWLYDDFHSCVAFVEICYDIEKRKYVDSIGELKRINYLTEIMSYFNIESKP